MSSPTISHPGGQRHPVSRGSTSRLWGTAGLFAPCIDHLGAAAGRWNREEAIGLPDIRHTGVRSTLSSHAANASPSSFSSAWARWCAADTRTHRRVLVLIVQCEAAGDDVGGHRGDGTSARVGMSPQPVDSLIGVDPELDGDHSAGYVDLCAGEDVGGPTTCGACCRGRVNGRFSAAEMADMLVPI